MSEEITELVPIAKIDHSPAGMYALAVANNQDIDKLSQMLDLQIRYEENEAKKAYHKAMSLFKSNPIEIDKDRHVKFELKNGGYTEYNHASLHNVATKISAAMSKFGLSAAWKTSQAEGGIISVTCTITHELGHSESTTLSAGPDQSGGKNNIQAVGSTVSYLQRYTLLAITGLATRDMDDDGNGSVIDEYIFGEDLERVISLIKETDSDTDAFWRFAQAESADTITTGNLKRIIATLERKKSKMRKPGEDDV